jgi:hypothetical protein
MHALKDAENYKPIGGGCNRIMVTPRTVVVGRCLRQIDAGASQRPQLKILVFQTSLK